MLSGEELATLLCCRSQPHQHQQQHAHKQQQQQQHHQHSAGPGSGGGAATGTAAGSGLLVVRGRALGYSQAGLQSAFLVSEVLQVSA